MKLSNRSSRALIAALALGVGLLVLLLGQRAPCIKQLDIACVKIFHIGPNKLIEHDPQADIITPRRLIQPAPSPFPFQLVRIGNDPDSIFEKSPPSPLDYAVILESLHNRGYRKINITTKLVWDQSPRLLATGLDTRLGLFESAIVPLSLSRAPTEGTIPPMLQSNFIPNSQIKGDTALIPTVNRLTYPATLEGSSPNTHAGFHEIENIPPASGKILMLANWNNQGFIPSTQLLTLMQIHGLQPNNLIIHCGKHIRLGNNGPVIAIDSYGQATPPGKANNPDTFASAKNAETFITQKKSLPTREDIALIYADGDQVNTTNALTRAQLENTLSLIDAFPVPDAGTPHPRIPTWAQLVILLDLMILIYWFRGMTRSNQHLVFLLTAALLLMLSLALMDVTQHWMAVSAPLGMLFLGWILPVSQRKTTTTMPEYSTFSAKPVIRA